MFGSRAAGTKLVGAAKGDFGGGFQSGPGSGGPDSGTVNAQFYRPGGSGVGSVSYTHLDVYKRQVLRLSATGTDKDTIPGMDMAENHLLGYNFMLITASPTEILIFMVFSGTGVIQSSCLPRFFIIVHLIYQKSPH